MAQKKTLKQEVTSADIVNALIDNANGSNNPNPAIGSIPKVLNVGEQVTNPDGSVRTVSADEAQRSLRAAGDYIMGDATVKNAFLSDLWNRIGRTIYEGRVYSNKLAPLEKGELPFGWSIQDIFVAVAKPYDYRMNEADGDNAKAIFAEYAPDVKAAYYHVNYRKFYPASTYDQELTLAFNSFDGVRQLVEKITQSLYNAAAWDAELTSRYIIARNIVDGNVGVESVPDITPATGTTITRTIKEASLNMENMGNEYNRAQVVTNVPVEEQYLIISNKYDSAYTVDVQSAAFNLDKVSYLAKRIPIRSFSFNATEMARLNDLLGNNDGYREFTTDELTRLESVNAMLIDKNFSQFYLNYENFTSEYDRLHLKTNFFLHLWRVFATSPFSNARAFVSSPVGVQSVTVSPTELTVQKGQYGQLTATVVTTGFAPKAVVWEIMEATNQSFVSETGVVSIGKNETFSTLHVKCSSAVDVTKSATATITVID